MNCNEVRENLLDLMVTEPGPGELRDHVKACAACAAEVTSMRRTMTMPTIHSEATRRLCRP